MGRSAYFTAAICDYQLYSKYLDNTLHNNQ